MVKLVEDIVSLEKEAGSIIARAREEAKEFDRICAEENAAYRQSMAEETELRISEFRGEAEESLMVELYKAETELISALDKLEHIPDDLLQAQASQIVSRLRNR